MAIRDDERVAEVLQRTTILSEQLRHSVAELVDLLCGAEEEEEPSAHDRNT